MSAPSPGADAPDPRRTILLVEDSDTDAALVTATLRRSDLHGEVVVQRVERLHDAVAQVGASTWCVLLDLHLPDCAGLEGLERLVAAAPEVPVVFLTGYDDGATAGAALARGAQDYLVKGSFDGATLARTVRYAVERKRAQVATATQARLNSAVLDAMEVCTAVVGRRGDLVAANEPWRRFAAAAAPGTVTVGRSYVEACRAVGLWPTGEGPLVESALAEVLAGARAGAELEYVVDGGAGRRWFELRITSMGEEGAVVTHLDVTARKDVELNLTRMATQEP